VASSPGQAPLSDRLGRWWLALFFAALLALMAFISRAQYVRHEGLRWTPPLALEGDCPHYMVVLHALLYDRPHGAMDLRASYRRALLGGPESGAFMAGRIMVHHTLVVDRETGPLPYWEEIYDGERPIYCEGRDCVPFARKGDGGPIGAAEVSSHPMAYPALL
jgi:hypothetical protein